MMRTAKGKRTPDCYRYKTVWNKIVEIESGTVCCSDTMFVPFNNWHFGWPIDQMMHKLEAMEITIIMPNDPMVWIGIYWSAALLQHIFLKSVTCQAHSHHAKLFSSSVNGTRNLQYRGHMRPAFMALPDYFILYSRLKVIVMECPVKSRWPIP